MKAKNLLLLGAIGAAGYFLWNYYQDQKEKGCGCGCSGAGDCLETQIAKPVVLPNKVVESFDLNENSLMRPPLSRQVYQVGNFTSLGAGMTDDISTVGGKTI